MKYCIQLILMFLISCNHSHSQFRFWEELNRDQQDKIKNSCESTLMVDYYNNSFVISDEEIAWKLLNDILVASDSILPLSFYLLNKITLNSDGSLGESLTSCQIDFFVKHPSYVMQYFAVEIKRETENPVWRAYAEAFGYELYFKKQGSSDIRFSYEDLKEMADDVVKREPSMAMANDLFWKTVDQTMVDME